MHIRLLYSHPREVFMENKRDIHTDSTVTTNNGNTDSHTALFMNKRDNVATLLSEAKKGDTVTVRASDGSVVCVMTAGGDIVRGHKIAISDIKNGEDVIKYGFSIGRASGDIKAGDYVHTHNLVSNRGRGDLL